MQQKTLAERKHAPMQKPTKCKILYKQLKLAHKVVSIVDFPMKKICVTLVRYNVLEAEKFFLHKSSFCKKQGDKKPTTLCLNALKTW